MDKRVAKKYKKKSRFRETWRRMARNKTAMAGLAVLAVILLCAVFADAIAPYSKSLEQNMGERYLSPSLAHPFGTDLYGRDIFARVIHGTRNSLLMGIGSVAVGISLGGLFGSIAGFFGGKAEMIIMRLLDMIMCIPFMLLALAIVAALGAGLVNVLIALMLAMVPYYTRVIRSAILNVVEMDYIKAARACGTPNRHIILKHVLPNAIGPIIVQATMSVGNMIISAAAMSFLGMGIQPPAPEWGSMLSEGREYMFSSPHMVIFPGLAITITALSVNLMGDGLRDALDPRLKE
ncbi:MAG: ABC transporter permease [Clostridiales bacterium]|jgi:peptide/nickel transport system permease protein|nr:ABC transporter permease [Clostridiales bacterium]